jgi:pyruvate oxidase
MNEADLLLVVGASFANHTGIAPYKPTIQVDDAPAAIGRFSGVELGMLGDAVVTLSQILDRVGLDAGPGNRSAARRRSPMDALAR